MFGILFDSLREVVESAVGTLFFGFCLYLGLPFVYGGISLTPDTTLSSVFIDQPINWWWSSLSGHIIGFFEWVFTEVGPFVVPQVLDLIQYLGVI